MGQLVGAGVGKADLLAVGVGGGRVKGVVGVGPCARKRRPLVREGFPAQVCVWDFHWTY